MWLVQQLHERMVLTAFDERMILRDSRPAPDLRSGDCCASPYCDNLGVIGTQARHVLSLRESVQEAFEKAGFAMHEETGAEGDAVILGGRFRGDENRIVPSPRRFVRVRKAFRWLSRRPRITGQELERMVGHGIYLGLLHRPM